MYFSIILPVHNGGEHIKLCVDSILNQTYPNFNLIILENCSNDGTFEWLELINDKRVKVFCSAKSLTIEENWQRIVGLKKYPFMTLIGHDDLLEPSYLQEMKLLIEQHSIYDLYFSHFKYIDKNGAVIRSCKFMKSEIDVYEFTTFFLKNEMDCMGTGFVMNSKLYDDINGIPNYPNLLFADFELWINILGKNKLIVSQKNLFSFRIHQSTTSTSSVIKFYNAYKQFLNFLSVKSLKDPAYEKIVRNYVPNFIKFYTKSLAHRVSKTRGFNRNDLKVKDIIDDYEILRSKYNFQFSSHLNRHMLLSKFIDENSFFRNAFLFIKKFCKKPFIRE